MKIILYLLILLIIVLGVSFASLNMSVVDINYYVGSASLPLSLLLSFTLAIGGVLGIFASFGLFISMKTKLFKLQHKLKVAEKELENIRLNSVKG